MSARICISSSYRFSISSCVGPHLPETRLTRSLQAMLSTRLAAVALSVALLLLAGQCKGYQHISHSSLSRGRSTSQAGKPIVGATALRSTPTSEEVEMSEEVDIFGAEFIQNIKNEKNGIKTISFEDRQRVMGGYTKVRTTILADAVFIGVLGISLTWFFGRYEDAFSFALGSVLGIMYSVLLGKFVEKIGSGERSTGESARFIPVIALIAVYGKYKTFLSIAPQLLGFFLTYLLASLLQAWNKDLYGEKDDGTPVEEWTPSQYTGPDAEAQ
jgi:hypothetical protein